MDIHSPVFFVLIGFFLVLIIEQIIHSYKDRHLHQIIPFEHDENKSIEGENEDQQKNLLALVFAVMFHKGIMAFSLGINLTRAKVVLKVFMGCILIFSIASPIGIAIGIGLMNLPPSLSRDIVALILQAIAGGTFLYITFIEVLFHELNYNMHEEIWNPLENLLIRFWVERLVFRPLGLFLGLGSTKKNLPMLSNLELEDYYLKHKDKPLTFFKREALNLAVNLNMSERKIQRWFRMRRGADKSKLLDKFSETGWKSWIWDIRNCWYHYPHHLIDTDIWWYYMVELSFYWSLLFSQFYDVKRKDFWEMFIHHLTTIALMGFSWTCNLTRVGTNGCYRGHTNVLGAFSVVVQLVVDKLRHFICLDLVGAIVGRTGVTSP
ncbi:CERS5_6 [Lepeophtheirus salmonis]|uniref:CERS5_6 n=1 Tax=Lepeophtheirus salmonis TaxID=72036 RepID=A0A7R8H807_LEPSM|nr:CERS5_6 [Lepeophtheirus salmonis]CAF2928689.1 CERS5_6 [Lepeophtheirus salmonis]